jgi:hypothetical protein
MTTTSNRRPSHEAFVTEGEGKKTRWTKVGAMWPHASGDGFTLVLKALPLDGRIVLREPREDSEKEGA